MEAWRRLDPMIEWEDINMRIPRMHTRKDDPTPGRSWARPYRAQLWSNRCGTMRRDFTFQLSWHTTNEIWDSKSAKEIRNSLSDRQIQQNTTRGLTPGLIDPKGPNVIHNIVSWKPEYEDSKARWAEKEYGRFSPEKTAPRQKSKRGFASGKWMDDLIAKNRTAIDKRARFNAFTRERALGRNMTVTSTSRPGFFSSINTLGYGGYNGVRADPFPPMMPVGQGGHAVGSIGGIPGYQAGSYPVTGMTNFQPSFYPTSGMANSYYPTASEELPWVNNTPFNSQEVLPEASGLSSNVPQSLPSLSEGFPNALYSLSEAPEGFPNTTFFSSSEVPQTFPNSFNFPLEASEGFSYIPNSLPEAYGPLTNIPEGIPEAYEHDPQAPEVLPEVPFVPSQDEAFLAEWNFKEDY